MHLSVTPRQFAAALGVLMAIAGVIALSIPVTALSESGLFGTSSINCGSGFVDNTTALGGDPLAQCRDAIGDRRMWGWPLLIAGAVIAAGAMLVEATTRRSATEPADSSD